LPIVAAFVVAPPQRRLQWFDAIEAMAYCIDRGLLVCGCYGLSQEALRFIVAVVCYICHA
jgi:hypothetical protein